MLDRIIHFSIKNKLIIGLFVLFLISWGTYSLTRLPIDAVPDITDNQVMIITVSPTLAAQEVEQLVTFPVEQTMVSIPRIQQMRSFSRFGLSIVTIVFDEGVDIYWGRQQVNERLRDAGNQIPKGIGTPEIAPITTGLGEIYQYVIHPKKGYEDKYDAMELRTIQDWIVKRQLLGTPGVAEVSGFGGYVKQYEIAVDPDKLRSMNLTITDIFTALETNNQNTGGAYIDKNPSAYFIRSEGLVKKLEDLERIVITVNDNKTPILIRDVATVQYGHSVRYGAATRNGEGETVTGIVMMLKGANSSEVIKSVKEKIEQIKKTLPEGVDIEPFLDRKKLVDNAIETVTRNLIEGALIVIFILILFLGNLRAGLVVASVIPLAMLFAISMMNLFGVSGNLMSLGAIDFGLIVDGAVIIVEAILHRITGGFIISESNELSRDQMDTEVYHASSKIRNSAAFGEIIILMVYIPIWSLAGIEGKMFKPMAQTVTFAILGAFILSLTYVPMMSALALSRKTSHKRNFSDKMMDFFQRTYRPVIEKAIHHKLIVVVIAATMFVLSLIAFTRLGGEFIPQLDEGDFAVETRVMTGSSIQQMIEVSNKAQKILLQKFPEVNQVVNKIGSGEIPTDPMPIEAGDMMVILKPQKEWTTVESKEELIEKMSKELSVIPNATFSFQQPIQMRFNELITGAKQDVVIKIYGEDLDVLADLGRKVGNQIKSVDGAEDLYVEEITGLPQIQIEFNRDKIAQYGLNISKVNEVIRAAFAGESAGLVYEKERRFDLVVRLKSENRKDITDVQGLFISTPTGAQVPLNEIATVAFKPGPNQIQRDDAKRRITVGFNVRGRDVESIVKDIKQIIDSKVKLPTGYYVTYGGQFQNLQEAKTRLAIAVPVALLLILLLLYFTFHSIRESLLIFTAIPLSAIGGIVALLVRGMPFSISAGVGFIALFGVAVLNGIVLLAEFNRLAEEGVDDIYERVLKGTSVRLRPVLMTAAVASLGFLPMALSQTSGAEVQRPLATVVIGGLISATLLTLIVLPVLYIYFTRGESRIKPIPTVIVIFIALGCLIPSQRAMAQSVQTKHRAESPRKINLQQAVTEALQNNNGIRSAQYEVTLQEKLKKGAVTIPKTDVGYSWGHISSRMQDHLFNVTQRFEFPTVYSSQSKLGKAEITRSQLQKSVKENDLTRNVKTAYLQFVYTIARRQLLRYQDSVYKNLDRVSRLRYDAGETTKLETVTSQTQRLEISNQLLQNDADLEIAQQELKTLLNTTDNLIVPDSTLTASVLTLPSDTTALRQNPYLKYLAQEIEVSQRKAQVQKNKMLPDILAGYVNQSFIGFQKAPDGTEHFYGKNDRFSSFQVGIGIPLFPGGYRSRISAANVQEQVVKTQLQYEQSSMEGALKNLARQYTKHQNSVNYYQNTALPQAILIIESSGKSFKNGDISYVQHLQNLTMAVKIQSDYLDNLYSYNQSIIEIETLLGVQ